MRAFVLERLALFAATVAAAALILFVLLDTLPGDAAQFLVGAGPAAAALSTELGLDAPGWQRFFGFLFAPITGGFGLSATLKSPIGALIAERLAVTLPLTLASFGLAAALGLALGGLAAGRPGSALDRGVTMVGQLGRLVPPFWLGMLLVLLFAAALKWLPASGFVPWTQNPGAALASLVLPVLALALPHAAGLALSTRQAIRTTQRAAHMRTAEAIGMTPRQALLRHGLRNALLPLLGVLGGLFAALLLGTVIVENVFYLPGLGRLILTAITQRDLPLVRGGLLVLVALVALGMLLISLVRLWADPRLHPDAAR